MESVEDLILDLGEARAAYDALERGEPFESESLVNFLFMEAIEHGIDVVAILGAEEPFEADWKSRRASSPNVAEALAKKQGKTIDELGQHLARRIVSKLDAIERTVQHRRKQMALAEAVSFLGDRSASDKIIRYEAHLERQRRRLLKRLGRTNK